MIHRKRRFEIAVGLVLALIVTSCCEGTAMETMRAYAASAENWSVVYSDDLGFSKVYAVGGHVVIGMKDGVVCFYNLSTKKETKTKYDGLYATWGWYRPTDGADYGSENRTVLCYQTINSDEKQYDVVKLDGTIKKEIGRYYDIQLYDVDFEGSICRKEGDKLYYGAIDQEGNVVVPVKYARCLSSYGDNYKVKETEDGLWALYKPGEGLITDFEYETFNYENSDVIYGDDYDVISRMEVGEKASGEIGIILDGKELSLDSKIYGATGEQYMVFNRFYVNGTMYFRKLICPDYDYYRKATEPESSTHIAGIHIYNSMSEDGILDSIESLMNNTDVEVAYYTAQGKEISVEDMYTMVKAVVDEKDEKNAAAMQKVNASLKNINYTKFYTGTSYKITKIEKPEVEPSWGDGDKYYKVTVPIVLDANESQEKIVSYYNHEGDLMVQGCLIAGRQYLRDEKGNIHYIEEEPSKGKIIDDIIYKDSKGDFRNYVDLQFNYENNIGEDYYVIAKKLVPDDEEYIDHTVDDSERGNTKYLLLWKQDVSQMLYSFDIYGHGNEFEICEYNNGKSESEIYYYYNGKLNKDPQTEERKVEVRETQISDTLKQYEVLDEDGNSIFDITQPDREYYTSVFAYQDCKIIFCIDKGWYAQEDDINTEPTVKPTIKPTGKPTKTPEVTKTPNATEAPIPTVSPSMTPAPTPGAAQDAQGTATPSTTPSNTKATLSPATVGTTVKDKTASYKVISADKKQPAVAYTKAIKKNASSVIVPDKIKVNGVTYQVKSIAPKAFANNKKLKKITIGKNVASIGKQAFSGCKKLKKITIKSAKLKSSSIGKNAFKGTAKKLTFKVPKKKYKAYKKFLKKKGNKTVKVTK